MVRALKNKPFLVEAAYFFMLDIIAIITIPKVKAIINASNTVIGYHPLFIEESSLAARSLRFYYSSLSMVLCL